jgi:hypothetical protein
MRKDEAMGNKKKSKFVYLRPDNFLPRIIIYKKNSSVVDPGCLSRIPDPDFYPSWIPDLESRIQKQ